MADQVLINDPHAYSRVIELHNTHDSRGLRVYRDSPYTIHVQVRTATTKQGRIAGLSITRAEARAVAEYLLRKADELGDDPGVHHGGRSVQSEP